MSTLDLIKSQIRDCQVAITDANRAIDGFQKQTAFVRQTISARELELARLKKDLKLLEQGAAA